MAKRQIKIKVNPDGTIKVDNSVNPNEQQILKELAELSKLLNNDSAGFKVEQHKHGNHSHTHTHVHTEVGKK